MRKFIFILGLLAVVGVPLAGAQDPAPAPAPPPVPIGVKPEQVTVAVKVVEFVAEKGVETGFSAYFSRREEPRLWGRVASGNGAISTADLTFPSDQAAITVFLDRIRTANGDLEMVLQGLVTDNKAFILSRPTLKVMVGGDTSTIQTTQKNPYAKPESVGNNIVIVTAFKNTGVTLTVGVPEIIDDNMDWADLDDSYIHLVITATVTERGGDRELALDVSLTGDVETLVAPTFINRTITTDVWVRHGQTLVLGGLYRNRKRKSLDTSPWLAKAESVTVSAAERFIPGNLVGAPVSNTIGNRDTEEERRELVFFIRPDVWLPSVRVMDPLWDMDDEEYVTPPESMIDRTARELKEKLSPTGVISDIVEGVGAIPKELTGEISGQELDDGILQEITDE
jgi:Flp pilus assembly secretin CpaC